jgi:hypothetical protein
VEQAAWQKACTTSCVAIQEWRQQQEGQAAAAKTPEAATQNCLHTTQQHALPEYFDALQLLTI